ncbi:MAG: peptidylprolyl isomerase [Planctomycetota bacterium]
MRYDLAIILAVTSLILSTGCQNAEGNRASLWNWWKQDSASANQEAESDEATVDSDGVPTAEANADGPLPAHGSPASVTETPSPHSTRGSPPHRSPRLRIANPPSTHAIRSDVLLVNDETISVNDILEPITPRLQEMAAALSPDTYYRQVAEIVRQQILEAVAQHLVWRRAQSTITEDMETRLDKVVDKMEKERIDREFHGRETLYNNFLTRHDKTRTDVRERLRRSIVIDTYLRDRLLPLVPAPSKRQLKNYYDEHQNEYAKPARREMLLIDLPAAAFLNDQRRPPSEAELAEAREKAATAAKQAAAALQAGKDFGDVARECSKGVNASRGGNWGMIERPLRGRWELPSRRLFEMETGQTSEIIETADSFFIVKVGLADKRIVRSFRETQTEIADILKQRHLAKLRADFLQQELEKSTLGSLDDFVSEVLRAVPVPHARRLPVP